MPDSIGARIKACREAKGYSQARLARALDVDRSTIFRYEKGVTEKISLSTLEKIAHILDTTHEYLCYGKGPILRTEAETASTESTPFYMRSPAPGYENVRKESELNEQTLSQYHCASRFIMRVESEDLSPRIVPGDLLTIVVSYEIQNKYVNLLYMDGRVLLRRVTCENNVVTLMPNRGSLYSDIYTIEELKKKMKIIGYAEKLESTKP